MICLSCTRLIGSSIVSYLVKLCRGPFHGVAFYSNSDYISAKFSSNFFPRIQSEVRGGVQVENVNFKLDRPPLRGDGRPLRRVTTETGDH